MSTMATGSFTVEMKPQSGPDAAEGVSLGRMSLAKQFAGDLAATGHGEMVAPGAGSLRIRVLAAIAMNGLLAAHRHTSKNRI